MEVILTLLAFQLLYPDSLHLARGNHESRSMTMIYGFAGEVGAPAAPCHVPHAAIDRGMAHNGNAAVASPWSQMHIPTS